MERIAFHLEIVDGKRDAYREAHESVPEELAEAYLSSGAGIESYSVFEQDGHVFGFMTVENPEAVRRVMESSRAQSAWNEVMDPILEDGDGEIWMDEVYRMK